MGVHRACFFIARAGRAATPERNRSGNQPPILCILPLVAHQLASARECPWFGVAPSLGGGVVVLERLEPHQARLLRVDRQAVLAHSLGQHLQDPSGVIFSGYPDHEVVRVANQEGFSFQTRAHFFLEPFIQHVMQDDIGQERADHAPNNVVKPSLIPDSVISRTRLRPKYGQGWQPRLDPRPRQADGRGLGEEEST